MGGKVNVSFYNQYESKRVLLGGYISPTGEAGDIYPLAARV